MGSFDFGAYSNRRIKRILGEILKQIRVSIDDNVLLKLERDAAELGMKLQNYIQMILGQYVSDNKGR